MKRSLPRITAFTVMELLIVISIVAVLLLVSISASGYMRMRSASISCVNNLRQIGVATFQYAAEHRGELPYYFYLVYDGADTGSGVNTGTWFYNLAPYLNIPRTEVTGDYASEQRTYLGYATQPIGAPCVFTCPGHRATESKIWWTPQPMTWPTRRPVSYAPPLEMRGDRSDRGATGWQDHHTGIKYYPIRLNDIKYPSQKIWISDSPVPHILNVISTRWSEDYKENWGRQAFTRHQEGGNALFYDGHVEWLSLKSFTNSPAGPLDQMIRRYFHPYRDPALD